MLVELIVKKFVGEFVIGFAASERVICRSSVACSCAEACANVSRPEYS